MADSSMTSPRNTSESIGNRSIQPCKKVYVCRIGDKHYHKREINVSSKYYPTMGSFCDEVTKLFYKSGYCKGSVRKLYTEEGQPITNLERIDDGMLLVCGANESFRPLSGNLTYHDIEPITRLSPRKQGRAPAVGSHNKHFQGIEPKFHKIRNEGMHIFLQENGNLNRASKRVLLRSKLLDRNDMELMLTELGNTVPDMRLQTLFTLEGDVVTSPQQLQKNGLYIASPDHRFHQEDYRFTEEPKQFVCSKGQGYPIPYFLNDPFRWDHYAYLRYKKPLNKQIVQKPLSETRDVPRKHFTRNPLGPIKHHSPNHSVASNPEYGHRGRRKHNDSNGVPTAPVKHTKSNQNRTAPPPARKRNDHILTNGNDKSPYKASKGHEETRGAKEVPETKQTHTDVPIEQQKAEIVQDEKISPPDEEVSDISCTIDLSHRASDDSDKFQDEIIQGQTTARKNSVTMHHDKKLNPHDPLPAIGSNKKDSVSDGIDTPTETKKDGGKQDMTEEEAATRIQASFRGHKDRQKVEQLKSDKEPDNNTLINGRDEVRDSPQQTKGDLSEDEGSAKNQVTNQGNQDKQKVKNLKDEKEQVKNDSDLNLNKTDREREEEAATKIQASIRGHQARKDVQRMKEEKAAVTIQASIRGHQARNEVQKMKEEKAAVTIQASIRGHQARQEVNKRREQAAIKNKEEKPTETTLTEEEKKEMAATTIQASIRGHQARKEVEKRKEDKAAMVIQASIRGHLARKDLKEKKEQYRRDQAATAIQSSIRGYLTRKELGEKKKQQDDQRTSTPVNKKLEEDNDVVPTSTQDKSSEKRSPPRKNAPGEDNEGKDNTASTKDNAKLGNENDTKGNVKATSGNDNANDNSTSGNDNTTSGKDNATQGNDNAMSGKDNATTGKDNATLGKDNAAQGNDNAMSGKDNATAGKDNATAGKDNATAGKDNTTQGNDNATPGKDNATTGIDNANPGTAEQKNTPQSALKNENKTDNFTVEQAQE